MTRIIPHNEADDLTLLINIANGDKNAFKIIFDKYHKGIYRYCKIMLSDESIADDIYQETFFTFYKNVREGVEVRNVRGYLASIVRSRCLDYLNKSHRYVSLEDSSKLLYEIDVAYEDTKRHLYEAIRCLPEQYREAFILFAIKEYSYSEIERMLGVSRNVVKNRIYRAKQGLQKILGPLLYGPVENDKSSKS